jgi:hypothetical protein
MPCIPCHSNIPSIIVMKNLERNKKLARALKQQAVLHSISYLTSKRLDIRISRYCNNMISKIWGPNLCISLYRASISTPILMRMSISGVSEQGMYAFVYCTWYRFPPRDLVLRPNIANILDGQEVSFWNIRTARDQQREWCDPCDCRICSATVTCHSQWNMEWKPFNGCPYFKRSREKGKQSPLWKEKCAGKSSPLWKGKYAGKSIPLLENLSLAKCMLKTCIQCTYREKRGLFSGSALFHSPNTECNFPFHHWFLIRLVAWAIPLMIMSW